MSYRQPPYVPANKDLAGRGEQHISTNCTFFRHELKKKSVQLVWRRVFSFRHRNFVRFARNLLRAALDWKKRHWNSKKTYCILKIMILRCERDFWRSIRIWTLSAKSSWSKMKFDDFLDIWSKNLVFENSSKKYFIYSSSSFTCPKKLNNLS